jgi:hypothetical protein
MKANPGNLQHTVDLLNIAFNIRHEILSRLDLPHIQCGPEGAEQSPTDTGNHVIKRRWILRASDLASVLFLVEVLDAAMNAEVKRLIKSLQSVPFDAVLRAWQSGFCSYGRWTCQPPSSKSGVANIFNAFSAIVKCGEWTRLLLAERKHQA